MVKVLTIIGSGNSAHVCAGLVDSSTKGSWEVRILTRSAEVFSNPNPTVRFEQNGEVRTGKIAKVSSNPADVVPGSDVVLWTGPVNATKAAFQSIADHVDVSKTVVSTIFGQGLTHVLAQRIFGEKVRFVALRNIPWLCRTVKRGHASEIVGAKTTIECCTLNVGQEWVTENLQPLFMTPWGPKIQVAPDFCPVVFNPANQIIHPAVYWGLFRTWNGIKPMKELPNNGWLYRDMDAVAGGVLQALDEELQNIKDVYYKATGSVFAGCKSVIPLRTRIMQQYTTQVSDPSSMHGTVGTNKAYSMAKTPFIEVDGGVAPHGNHRVVLDDIGWGLCVLVSIGDRLNCPTTTMKWLIEWHQKFMNKEFIVNGKLTGKDCSELVLLEENDPLELVATVAKKPVSKM